MCVSLLEVRGKEESFIKERETENFRVRKDGHRAERGRELGSVRREGRELSQLPSELEIDGDRGWVV